MKFYALLAASALVATPAFAMERDEPVFLLAQADIASPEPEEMPGEMAAEEPGEPAAEEASPLDTLPSLDDILAEPLPQVDDLSPDSSLMLDPGSLIPDAGDYDTRTERLTFTAPPQPEFTLKDRIRFRQVRTQALADPAVQEPRARADAATTDLEKREALKEYYAALFDKMRAIDSSAVENFKELERQAVYPLTTRRVADSVPLDSEAAGQEE